jgi:methylenetetrahydrofolate dehydrogenase (NADP+) / methenyltetrahydrofolate cyclohydrolase
MIIDGRAIAAGIYNELRVTVASLPRAPKLGIFTCAPNFETEKYLNLKEKKARDVGIETLRVTKESGVTTEEVIAALQALIEKTDGVVVQLPLPPHIDTALVLGSVPPSHDVDVLNPLTSAIVSPVVGAIKEILNVHDVPIFEKHVVVVGSGKLVGRPTAAWFMEQGASVSIVTKDTTDIAYYTKNADIIVLGAGVPRLLTPDMVKEGVAILDAGTSEDGGVLVGDADPACEEKASLFTPVPGGIGPITVAVLLRNLVELYKHG